MKKHLPSGWQEVKLQECLLEQPKYGMNAPAVKYDNLLPTYIRITDIDEYGNFIDGNKVSVNNDNYKEYILHKNDFLFARTGASVGKTYLYNEKDGLLVFAGYLIKVVPNQNKLNSLFLKYYTQSKRYWDFVKTTSARTGQPGINGKEYANMDIILPPLDEQNRIADILSTFDDLIENLTKLIEKKELYKKGVMQRVLSGEVRFNGFTDEWKTVKLKDILIVGSKDRVPDTSKYKKITIKLHNKGIEFSNIERKMADKRPFYIRKKDEIIIGKQNYFNGSIAIVDEEFDNTICSNAIMSFTVNEDCNNKFIYFLLSRKSYMQKYYHLANGTGQKELSESDFLNFNLLIPSLEEQNKIAELLTLIDKDIEILKQILQLRKLQKKGVMQKLLTGEVRV
ncbi:restriction endonuclease subunit S [Brachyspira pilosicoli]|uniref:restriction endonuclease subunit S n=1 Tax=Brachyspira pilosicoli TaxID=52584 RepID=UPI0030040D7B